MKNTNIVVILNEMINKITTNNVVYEAKIINEKIKKMRLK